MTGRLDGRAVETDERVTGTDLVVALDEALEALAVHVHRADADVDEQLDAVGGRQADRVVGHRRGAHAAVARRVEHAVSHGQDTVPLAEQARGDDLVVDLLEAHEHARERRVDDVAARGEDGLRGRRRVGGPAERGADLFEQSHMSSFEFGAVTTS